MIHRSTLLLFTLILPGGVLAQAGLPAPPPGPPGRIQNPPPHPAPWTRETMSIARCEVPPVIDGKLDDPCWQTASKGTGFYRYQSDDPIQQQTEVRYCADKTHLYVAFHCLESQPNLIRAVETQREGNINQDDYVAVAIDSQCSRRNLSVFSVSARGTQVTQLEGGTADNITWAGDWKAVTQRTDDGWTCEISIPFALLKYPKGTNKFPLFFVRKLARETNMECWPWVPLNADRNLAMYMHDFTGIEPPYYAPKPVFLPYMLLSGGQGSYGRMGLDVKYPISTTMTGVATLFPDFATVENAVQDISFSYTEKVLQDRRPFFAEGNQFIQDIGLFYSQRIPTVDGGVKVVGKQGSTSVSLLSTTSKGINAQTDGVFSINHELGSLSNIGVAATANNMINNPANRVGRINGSYGWMQGKDQMGLSAVMDQSWTAGDGSDHNYFYRFFVDGGKGRPQLGINYQDIGPNYVNQLGYIPEVNLRGTSAWVGQFDQFDKGKLEGYYFEFDAASYKHATGGFFRDDLAMFLNARFRSGWNFTASEDVSKREENHDHTTDLGTWWGNKTLLQRGGVHYTFGSVNSQSYRLLGINQGIAVSKPFSMNLSYSVSKLGSDTTTQTILGGTYRLDAHRSFGGRLVQQDKNYNFYLSYGQHSRKGYDLFLLLGDPNAVRTRLGLTVKVVRPF